MHSEIDYAGPIHESARARAARPPPGAAARGGVCIVWFQLQLQRESPVAVAVLL